MQVVKKDHLYSCRQLRETVKAVCRGKCIILRAFTVIREKDRMKIRVHFFLIISEDHF